MKSTRQASPLASLVSTNSLCESEARASKYQRHERGTRVCTISVSPPHIIHVASRGIMSKHVSVNHHVQDLPSVAKKWNTLGQNQCEFHPPAVGVRLVPPTALLASYETCFGYWDLATKHNTEHLKLLSMFPSPAGTVHHIAKQWLPTLMYVGCV